jgi:P-type Cu+ transporter
MKPTETNRYTCSMHPEVQPDHPGNCPKCGMALEARRLGGEEETSPELADMTWRFWLSLAFTLPVFFIAMSDLVPGQPLQQAVSMRVLAWIQFALATPVVLRGGWPFFQRGWLRLPRPRTTGPAWKW